MKGAGVYVPPPKPEPFDVTAMNDADRAELLRVSAQAALQLSSLLLECVNNKDEAKQVELGFALGHAYVAFARVVDHGLANPRAMYQGRIKAGERLAQFMDRYPIEKGQDLAEIMRGNYRTTHAHDAPTVSEQERKPTASNLPPPKL